MNKSLSQERGERSPEAIKAARAAFIAHLLNAAGLGDEPDYPEPIIAD